MLGARTRQERVSPEEARWLKVLSTMNEFQARLYVADRALDLGRGGVSRLSQLTGFSRTTITKAIAELEARGPLRPAEGRDSRRGRGPQACGRHQSAIARAAHAHRRGDDGRGSDERAAVDEQIGAGDRGRDGARWVSARR